MPVMKPSKSVRNFTPNSSAWESLTEAVAGVADGAQMLQGQFGGAAVVNDQVTSAARALPELSLAPVAPPLTLAVKVVENASVGVGLSVATWEAALELIA